MDSDVEQQRFLERAFQESVEFAALFAQLDRPLADCHIVGGLRRLAACVNDPAGQTAELELEILV